MNELQKLYDVLSRDGYYTKSFDEFKVKWNDGAYRKKVYDVVSRDGLYTKSEDEFYKKYSGSTSTKPAKVQTEVAEKEPVKKKEPTVSASKLAQPTSVSSTKEDDFYTGGLGEKKKETKKEIARPSNVFVGFPGKEKNEYRVDNGAWQRRQPGKTQWTTITNEGSISALNKQFNKAVKPMAEAQKAQVANQAKRVSDLEQRLNQVVTGSLVSQDELSLRLSSDDAVAERLRNAFPGFKFTAKGGMSDRISVVAPTGATMELQLDNWNWDDDKKEAEGLKTFIRANSFTDAEKSSKKLDSIKSQRDKEIDVATNKLAAEGLMDRTQKFLDNPLAPQDPMALVKQTPVAKKEEQAISQKYQAPIQKAEGEYIKAKNEQFKDVYEMIRIDKSIDPKQAYASIRRDDRDIKIIGDFYNNVQKSAYNLDKKQKEEQARINSLAEKVKSGEMTMEEYDAIVEESNASLAAEAKKVSADLKSVSTASRAIDKSIGMNYVIEESRGSFGGGMAYKFVEGATAIPRLLSFGDMSKEDQDELVKSITGGDTSTQYVESEKRGDFSKAMFSLAESLGVMASSAALPGIGKAARYAGFFGMSYYEMKDELDNAQFKNKETGKIEKIPERDKVLLSAGYGILSSVLENFGVDLALTKTAFGKNLTNNIMKRAFLGLSKEATEAEIRTAINSSVNSILSEIGVKAGIGAAAEALTEGAQSLSQVGIEEVYDEYRNKDFSKNKGLQEALSNAAYEGYLGAIGGGVMSIAQSSPQALKIGFNSVYKQEELEALINATKIEGINSALVNKLKADLLTGNMSKEEAKSVIESFNKIQGKVRSMPNTLSPKAKAESLELMIEREEIEREVEGKDPNLVKPQKARIAEINSRLEQIGEENAVQEQATGEVPVQPETGVSGEVAERTPETTTEQVTEEGDQAVEQEEIVQSEENQALIDAYVQERTNLINQLYGNLEVKQELLDELTSDPIAYAEENAVYELTGGVNTNFLNSLQRQPATQETAVVEEQVPVVQETVQADVQQAPVAEEVEVEEITPEVQQELDEFETILADEGFAFEEELAPETEAEVEDVVVPAPPSRRGRGVSSKTPTAEAPTQPTPAKKKTKKQLVKEAKERFIADIDEKINREKTVRDVKLSELANKRTRATNQGNREESQRLFLEMEDIKAISKRKIAELEAKKANPSAFARFRKRTEGEEAPLKEKEVSAIEKKMNQMPAEEREFEEPTVSGEVEINPAEDSKQPEGVISKVLKFLGLKSKDQMLRKIEDFDGIPMIMAMSDILSSGEIKDAMGNVMVVDGGLGFNTFGRNMELAWAGVTKEGAQKQYDEAVKVYEANKELFDRLWAEGKIPKGHIPMAVMRMGNTAVNSNEAVFRYVLPYIQSLPLENRKAALNSLLESLKSKAEGNAASIWYTELSEKLDNGELQSVQDVREYLEKIASDENTQQNKKDAINKFIKNNILKNKEKRERNIDDIIEDVNKKIEGIVPFMLIKYINDNNIETLDGLFEAVIEESKKRAQGEMNMFSLPIRDFLYNSFFSKEDIKTNSLPTIKTLLNGVENARNELFTSDYLYQQIGDPSMMKTKMGDVVGVMGIDVINGGVAKSTHNNYGYGPKGRLIAFISNPKQGVDVFPEFRSKAARVFKKDKKGNYPNADAVAGQTGGAFFMDSAFRGAKPRFGAITDMDMLIGKLRFAFPEVSVSNTKEEWTLFVNQEGIRTREKNGEVIYGVTKDGRIFLNPDYDSLRTPIHEFGHIWIDYLRSSASGSKGSKLLAKGLELVDGTKEYKRALKEYGDRDIALEEALVELLATKGDTIINAAQRSEFKSWMNAMFKYIKENLVRSKNIAKDKIKDLTLDEFINIGLADLFSGERVSGKFDARFAETAAKARKSKQTIVNNIVEIGRAKGISDAAIKEALKKRGYTTAQINEALTVEPETTQAPVDSLNEFLDSINTVVKEYAASARKKVRADMKAKRAVLTAKLKAMQDKGSITAKQAQALLEKVNKLNLSNTASVDRFLQFAENVFKNAEYVDSLSTINKLIPAAKRSIKSKLGIANDLVPLLQTMLGVKPSFVPMSVFDTYKSIIETIGKRQTELTLPEISEIVRQVQEVNDAIDVESGLAVDLANRLESYPDKIEDNGKLQYTETINKMLEDGIINEYELGIMKKYRSMIAPTERTKKSEQELQDEKNQMIDSLKNETVDSSTLPSRDERNLANKLASFIKTDVLNFLTAQELSDLQKIVDNINNGFITNRAQILVEKMDGIIKRNNLISPIQRVKVMLGERLKSGAKKALFRKKGNYYKYILEGNSSAFIDEVFGNFRERPFYENIFKPLATALASFSAENRVVADRITKMEQSLAKAFGRNQNKMTMSKFKMMTWLIQNEFESNPNSRQVNPAIEFLKKTIKETNAERTYYSQYDVKMFEEIIDKYQDVMKDENGDPILDKDGNEVMGIDMDKLYDSFNPTEKKILGEIRTINDMMSEKAEYTAAIIRGSRITPIANYISLGVINGDTRADQLDSINELRNVFGNSRTTSTRAKTLIERTGKVSAINFDPFSSVRRSASSVLMDYHLTPAVRQGRFTMRELEKAVDNNEIAEDKLPLVTALDAAFTQIIDTAVGNEFISEGRARSIINEISRQGYRAVLAGIPRMASEAVSNMAYIITKGSRSWAVGASYGKLLMSPDAFNVLKNVGSVQTNRIYSSSTVSSQMAASEIFNQTAGIKGSQAKGVVANAAQTIYNQTLKRAKNTTEATADLLMSTPDMVMIRPLWFGEFSRAFKKASGNDVDFEKIANNDEQYMADNKEAIDAAKDQADNETIKAGSSDNNALGILRNTVKPDDNEMVAWYKKFNSYMAKFLLFEYMTARSGVNMLMKGNMIEKKEGIALIAAVTTRMMVYQIATRTLTNGFVDMVAGLLGYRDDEEEEEDDKTVMQRVGQAVASTMSTLLFGRNFGNAARVPLNYGVELLNEKYLEDLRKGDYDQYEDALNYTLIPMDKPRGETGKGIDVIDIFLNTLGSTTPAVKTIKYVGMKLTEDEKKTAEAKERQSKERMLRVPLEIAGSLGYIPLYKDVRKVTMDAIYGDLDRSEKVTSQNAPKLIESAQKSFKSSLKQIGEMRKDREVSIIEAREMTKEAKEEYREKIRSIREKLRKN